MKVEVLSPPLDPHGAALGVRDADPTLSVTTSLGTRRTSNVRAACVECHRAKRSCSQQRPCERCIKIGRPDDCIDHIRKKRITKAEKQLLQSQAAHLRRRRSNGAQTQPKRAAPTESPSLGTQTNVTDDLGTHITRIPSLLLPQQCVPIAIEPVSEPLTVPVRSGSPTHSQQSLTLADVGLDSGSLDNPSMDPAEAELLKSLVDPSDVLGLLGKGFDLAQYPPATVAAGHLQLQPQPQPQPPQAHLPASAVPTMAPANSDDAGSVFAQHREGVDSVAFRIELLRLMCKNEFYRGIQFAQIGMIQTGLLGFLDSLASQEARTRCVEYVEELASELGRVDVQALSEAAVACQDTSMMDAMMIETLAHSPVATLFSRFDCRTWSTLPPVGNRALAALVGYTEGELKTILETGRGLLFHSDDIVPRALAIVRAVLNRQSYLTFEGRMVTKSYAVFHVVEKCTLTYAGTGVPSHMTSFIMTA